MDTPYRAHDGPAPHAWQPCRPGSALDVCANDCGLRRLLCCFIRDEGSASRWMHQDPGCDALAVARAPGVAHPRDLA